MNLAAQPASRPAHCLFSVPRDACAVLMHSDNRRVDHPNGCVMRRGQRVHDPAPDTSPPPADEAIIRGSIRPEATGRVAPRCAGAQDPEDAIEDTAVICSWYAARLTWQQ